MLARVGRAAARDGAGAQAPSLEVPGPSPAPIARVRNRFRFRVMLRSSSRERLRHGALAIHAAIASLPRTVRASIDVDPVGAL